VAIGVPVTPGVIVSVTACVAVAVTVAVPETVAVDVGVPVAVRAGVDVAVTGSVAVAVAVPVAVIVAVPVGVPVTVMVAVPVTVIVAVIVFVPVTTWSTCIPVLAPMVLMLSLLHAASNTSPVMINNNANTLPTLRSVLLNRCLMSESFLPVPNLHKYLLRVCSPD
jgi:hypothetical protein